MSERITGHTELIGLIAYPIRHSSSPKMHNEAFAKLGLDYAYLAFEVDNDTLEDTVKGFRAMKVRGWNVSMPNKTVIGKYLDKLTPAAEMCGAVNTVVNDNGVLTGTITDGVAEISIFNRKDKFWANAEETVEKINKNTNCKAKLFDLDDKEALRKEIESSYILTNATGMGMKPLEGQTWLPDTSFLREDLIVTDTVYAPAKTKLLEMAESVGCKTLNGFPMMLYQGAAAFELWTGKEMPVDHIKKVMGFDF